MVNQQEVIFNIQMLGQEAEKVDQQVQLIDQQITELGAVKESISSLAKDNKSKEILANLGKGIFVKAKVEEEKLLVNVGREIIVKKTPAETIKVINDQLLKLESGKEMFVLRIQDIQEKMKQLLERVKEDHEEDKESQHIHDENCKHHH